MKLIETIDKRKVANQEHKSIFHADTPSYVARFFNATSIWNSGRNDVSAQPRLSVDTLRTVRHIKAITPDLVWFA